MGFDINTVQGSVNSMVQMNDAEAALNEQAAPAAVSQEGPDGINPSLPTEILCEIIPHCDLQTTGRLACVNKYFNACVKAYMERLDPTDLTRLCPKLTILDAKAQGITVDDEPQVNKLQVLKWCKELAPHVENNEGLTLLTMPKGLTLNQLAAIATAKGITVDVWDELLQEHGNVPVEQTYVIVITDSVFRISRSKIYAQQQELVARHRCVMPTVQEYVAHCVFTNIVYQKCIYRQDDEQTLWTYGRSSTHVQGFPLAVGCSGPARVDFDLSLGFGAGVFGVGGQRKL